MAMTGTSNWIGASPAPAAALASIGPAGIGLGDGTNTQDITLSRAAASSLRVGASKLSVASAGDSLIWLGEPTDANPMVQLSTTALSFGPGGAAPSDPDVKLERTGTGTATLSATTALSIPMAPGLTLNPLVQPGSTNRALTLGSADLYADQLVSARNNPGTAGSEPYGLRLSLDGDTFDRVGLKNQGAIAFGPGLSAPDVERMQPARLAVLARSRLANSGQLRRARQQKHTISYRHRLAYTAPTPCSLTLLATGRT